MSKVLKEHKGNQANVRIDLADKLILDELAGELGESHPKVLHQALKHLKRKLFFEKMNRAYREMQADSQVWSEELAERELFENAGGDGLS